MRWCANYTSNSDKVSTFNRSNKNDCLKILSKKNMIWKIVLVISLIVLHNYQVRRFFIFKNQNLKETDSKIKFYLTVVGESKFHKHLRSNDFDHRNTVIIESHIQQK